MREFDWVRIGDIGDVITGRTPETANEKNYGTDFRFIGPADLHKHFFINSTEKMISMQGLESIKSSALDGISILVGCIGWDIGNVAIVKGKCVTNQQINSITNISERYNPFYIYYWLKNKKAFLFQQASVTRTPILNKTNFSEIKINLPKDRSVQDRIADLLVSIDKKIDLNNSTNTNLEAMAKTIYDYWFVQFDFPDENGKPYKSSNGKMEYNVALKREIPVGWKDGSLFNLGDIVGGSTPSTSDKLNFSDNAVPWITPNDLSENNGYKFISKGNLDVTEKGMKRASLKLYPKNTVLMSSRAPIGYMAIARNPVTTNQGFKSFIPNKGYSTAFVYYAVKNAMKVIIQYSSGSTFKEISGATLKTVKVCLPLEHVVNEYTKRVSPIFSKQDLLEQENQQLTQLRDWLLPMLMNGQIKVA